MKVDPIKLQELTYLIKKGLNEETAYSSAFKILSSAVNGILRATPQ